MQDTLTEITEEQWQEAVKRVEQLRDKRLAKFNDGRKWGLIPSIAVSCYNNLLMQFKDFGIRTKELYDRMLRANENTYIWNENN